MPCSPPRAPVIMHTSLEMEIHEVAWAHVHCELEASDLDLPQHQPMHPFHRLGDLRLIAPYAFLDPVNDHSGAHMCRACLS